MKKIWGYLDLFFLVVTLSLLFGNDQQATASKVGNVYSDMTSASLARASNVKPNSKTTFDILLKPRSQGELYQDALNVNSPTSSMFKQYLTAAGFRQKYGQPSSITRDWQQYLNKFHLKTHVFGNGLTLMVSGKAKNMNRLLRVNLNQATYHKDPLQFGKKKAKIPARLAQTVWTLLGVADHNKKYFFPNTKVRLSQSSNVMTQKRYTSSFTNRYRVNQLYKQGMTGKGQTVGIIAFGGIKRSNIYHFWKHEKVNVNKKRLSIKTVNASKAVVGFNPDDSESTMDVEYAGSVAKDANVRVYLAKTGAPTLTSVVNTYTTAYDENQASALSTSWELGPESLFKLLKNRKVISPDYLKVFNFIFAQGAIQGISNFVAAGDSGAYNYGISGIYKNRVLLDRSVQGADPFSTNPWITSVGGTTLPFKLPIKAHGVTVATISNQRERAWGSDYMWPYFERFSKTIVKSPAVLTQIATGGDGGFSHLYDTPAYQLNVPGVNTFYARASLSQLGQPLYHAALTQGSDYGRNYPDISANADPFTGYQVYQPKRGNGSWQKAAGTSIVSPQFAGVAAVINSGRQQRMGFWNPQLYRLAMQTNTPFTVLNSTENNSNLYYTGQPNTDYNQASGLGTVDFEKLANDFK